MVFPLRLRRAVALGSCLLFLSSRNEQGKAFSGQGALAASLVEGEYADGASFDARAVPGLWSEGLHVREDPTPSAVSLTSEEEGGSQSPTRRQLQAAPSGTPLIDTWTPPLSTRGRYIVDANGNRFRLRSGNFHGSSGTYNGNGNYSNPANHHAGELAYQTVLCLDRVSLDRMIQDFLNLGINSIRLPFSNEMIHTTTNVPDSALNSNPQLRGMTPLQIFDAVIEALTAAGLAVILNNHTVKSIWCCGLDQNSRWNLIQSDKQWEDDWVFMMKRYADNKRVVGAEMYNEVRRDLAQDPVWGSGGVTDWYQASLTAGTRIQREANPDALIVVEGINWQGIPLPSFPHGRPELSSTEHISHALPVVNKLVYSAHFYAYTGRNNTGASGGPFVLNSPLYRDLSVADLNSTMDEMAGYVALNASKHYTAPVWISEFGSAGRYDTLTADRNWWRNFISWMIDRDMDFAYWPLTGWQTNGQGDLWALTSYDSNGNAISISDPNNADWRYPDWQRLMQAQNVKTGTVDQAATYRMLFADNTNAIASTRVAAATNSFPGQRHAVCPDGLRQIGLTAGNNPRGLCTDAVLGQNLWNASTDYWEFINDERHVSNDWARGFTKYTCARNQHLIGYSFTGRSSEGAYCAQYSTAWGDANIIANTRTVYFNQQSNYPTDHGPFTAGGNTGACNDDEVAMGYAFSNSQNGGTPAALYCGSVRARTSSDPAFSTVNAAMSLSVSPSATMLATLLLTFLVLLL